MKWSYKDTLIMIDCMKDPFNVKKEIKSARSVAATKRNCESAFNTIVHNQIKKYREEGLPFSTPEEWDNSFKLIGGSSSWRTSSVILSKMTWTKFLNTFLNED